MLRSVIFGREVTGEQSPRGTSWRYSDSTLCAFVGATPESFRYSPTVKPCPECGLCPGPQGEDPCLGVVVGVSSACCGHGISPVHVVYNE